MAEIARLSRPATGRGCIVHTGLPPPTPRARGVRSAPGREACRPAARLRASRPGPGRYAVGIPGALTRSTKLPSSDAASRPRPARRSWRWGAGQSQTRCARDSPNTTRPSSRANARERLPARGCARARVPTDPHPPEPDLSLSGTRRPPRHPFASRCARPQPRGSLSGWRSTAQGPAAMRPTRWPSERPPPPVLRTDDQRRVHLRSRSRSAPGPR